MYPNPSWVHDEYEGLPYVQEDRIFINKFPVVAYLAYENMPDGTTYEATCDRENWEITITKLDDDSLIVPEVITKDSDLGLITVNAKNNGETIATCSFYVQTNLN